MKNNNKKLHLINLTNIDYNYAWDKQKKAVENRKLGLIPDTLFFVEHEPVYTLGKNSNHNHLLDSRDLKIPIFNIERGGDVTFHGPGQIIFYFAIDLRVYSFGILFLYLFMGSFLLGSAGFIAGLHCVKFDHMATITNFFIVPLSFLSGTFYSIEKLPVILQKISLFNPFFHIIDGFRYGVIGNSDGPILFGFIYLSLLSILLWIVCFYLYKKGYKIKF